MGGDTAKIESERFASMRVQTSAYGMVIPLVYGRTRISGNLIWYGDFQAIAHTETSGGKGGGGVETTTYAYQASVAMGLCEGEIIDVRAVWKGKDKQGDGYANVVNEAHIVPLVAPYTVTIADWVSEARTRKNLKLLRRLFGGALAGSTQLVYTVLDGVYTFPPAMAGETVYLTYTKRVNAAAALGMSIFKGDAAQVPWSHLTTNYIDQALTYPGVAYVAAAGYSLTGGAALDNHSFEVIGRLPYNYAGGVHDANVKDVVVDFIANPIYGAAPGFPLDPLTAFSDYCLAADILIAPYWADQRPAHEYITDLARIGNSAPVWSEGKLKLIPYADSVIEGRVTYTPNVTPIYDLTDDDFLGDKDDPVKVKRKTQADAFNQVQIEFTNRANDYNNDVVEAKDQADIELHGLRPMAPLKMPAIVTASVGETVANTVLDRVLHIRNQYEVQLGWRYALLEPMDIVTLTDLALGLDQTPVRIIEVGEDADGKLTVIFEEFPAGVSAPALFPSVVPLGYNADYNTAPGNANEPVLFEPPMSLAGQGARELWLATSGGSNWGGAEVWVSWDDATYKRVGVIEGWSRHGVLSASMATGGDPDTVNTLAVDMSISGGQLLSGTLADRDALRTLCYVDGEYISYQTATLTATNKYNLSSLRRGQHGSTIGAHNIGTDIARVDDALFKYPYEAVDIGKTLYIKLRSFNLFSGGYEELADLTPYTHVVTGAVEGVAVPPPNVNTFLVSRQSDGTRQFTWTLTNPPADLTGYEIRYKLGSETDWDAMTPMHSGALLASPFESNQLAAGTYTFAIKAVDIFGNKSVNAAFIQATLGDPRLSGALEVFDEFADAWPGTKTSCHLEPSTGYLQPDETAATPWTGTWAARTWIKTPATSISYERLIDVGVVATFSPLVTALANGTVTITEAHSDDGVSYTSYATAGAPVTCRYIKVKITVTGALPVLMGAITILSASPISEDFEDLATAGLTGSYRIGTGDIRIPLTKTFAVVRRIDVTLQNVGAGWSWELIDKDTTVGPRIKIYNASNTLADATIDVTVRGL